MQHAAYGGALRGAGRCGYVKMPPVGHVALNGPFQHGMDGIEVCRRQRNRQRRKFALQFVHVQPRLKAAADARMRREGGQLVDEKLFIELLAGTQSV